MHLLYVSLEARWIVLLPYTSVGEMVDWTITIYVHGGLYTYSI